MSIQRQWKQLQNNEIETNPEFSDLIVMQWNILADGLAQDGSFDNVDSKHLTWEYRLPLIVNEIRSYNPDIFCLEELNRIEDLSMEFHDYYVIWGMVSILLPFI
jgi:mRNA deadenylase 3'-5' endonuclease subunit Ccr4